MAHSPSDLTNRPTRVSGAPHLLAPRDASERVARAQLVLAMLAALTVVTLAALLVAAMP